MNSKCRLHSLVTEGVVQSRKWALDTQHEDYRAMAEGLRVKFFWKVAGIKDSVADHYLGKQRSELDCIRNGFRGWNVAEDRQNHGNPDFLESEGLRDRLGFVRKYWIDHQQKYFARAAERDLRYNERFELLGFICIAGVAGLGVALFCHYVRHHEFYFGLAAIGLETLLAAAAIFHHFNNRMAYSEHAKQYQAHGHAIRTRIRSPRKVSGTRRLQTCDHWREEGRERSTNRKRRLGVIAPRKAPRSPSPLVAF
jgi:hypothetical protein